VRIFLKLDIVCMLMVFAIGVPTTLFIYIFLFKICYFVACLHTDFQSIADISLNLKMNTFQY